MRKSTVLLSVAALASATTSALLWSELRTERELNAELSARLEQVTANVAAAPGPAAVASPQLQPSAAPPAVVTPTSTESVSQTARRGPITGEDWMARQRELLADPRYREAWREQQRVQQSARREKLIDLLGFSAEQADAVIDLGIDRQLSWQFQTQPNPMTEEYMREQKERSEVAQRAEKAKLREVLGEAKYARYQEYLESSGTRQQVDRLRMELSSTDALREDQVEPLIAAIHAEQSQMMNEVQAYRESLSWEGDASSSMQKFAEHQIEGMKAAHARVRTAAGAILSNTQLEHLNAMLKRDLARDETQLRMQIIQSKLEQPPVAAGSSN